MERTSNSLDLLKKLFHILLLIIPFVYCENVIGAEDNKGAKLQNQESQNSSISSTAISEKLMERLTGNFSLTSNYIFRGISQTTNLPAFQGGLNYALPLGFYLNIWGSNVKFIDTDATLEMDPAVGFHKNITDDLIFDLSFLRYLYPSARELNYNELIGVVNYKFIQAMIGHSTNVYNVHKSGTYYNAGINYTIPSEYISNIKDISIMVLFGHYSLPKDAGNSYNDMLISIAKKMKIYKFALQWTDTNHRNPPYDKGYLVGSITVNF